MEITLSTKQKQQLKIQHDTTRDGRVRDRIKAVIHASNGWGAAEIAVALFIHETTVRQHINDYLSSCKPKPENGGSISYLSSLQTQEVIQHLTENTYHCTKQIIGLVFESYGVLYSTTGINKWLHHNSFS